MHSSAIAHTGHVPWCYGSLGDSVRRDDAICLQACSALHSCAGAAPEPSSAAPPKDAAASAFLADCISHTARMLNSLFADASTAREFVDRGGAPASVSRTVLRMLACVHIQHKPCMHRVAAESTGSDSLGTYACSWAALHERYSQPVYEGSLTSSQWRSGHAACWEEGQSNS